MGYGAKYIRSLYYSLPPAAKNFIASAYGLQERRERYNETYHTSLSFLRESQFWSKQKLLAYQREQTQEFLQNVIRQTPYYRTNKPYLDLLENKAPLEEFPIITKADLRRDTRAFYHDNYKLMHCRQMHTSGTTGAALIFPVSAAQFQREQAFRALAYEWGEVSLHGRTRVAFCAGHPIAHPKRRKPPFWVYDRANNWLYLSSYHLAENNLRDYIKELERFQPAMLGGYPSSLYLLALAYKKFGAGRLKLKSVFSSSETLTEGQRAAIVAAFGARVHNWYGSAEMCGNIIECEQGELHLKPEHSAVEILRENDEPCAPGETGRLVCTGFGNHAFPLIRYAIGDAVTIAANQSARCGRGGLLLDALHAREVDDYILTPEGRFVGRLDHLFKDSVNVIEAQLYQELAEELVCRIVKNERYSSADEQAIIKEARLRLGDEIKITFAYVESIPRAANGKFRFVVSLLNQQQLINGLKN